MRTLTTMVLALLIVLGLFWFMQYLISGDELDIEKPERLPPIDVVRDQREEEPPLPPEETPPPDRPERPPSDPEPTPNPEPDGTVNLPVPPIDVPEGIDQATHEADPVPIAMVPPQYPREAEIQGIEGWVRIEFTIEANGSVSNARVIAASPRHGIFDAEALRAIQRWRFRPEIRDDQPVASSGHRVTIRFELPEDG